MGKLPYLKFFPSDWRTDIPLQMCSLGAQGLWINLLAIMHLAEVEGVLIVKGQVLGTEEIAALIGKPVQEVEEFLKELEDRKVFDRGDRGEIISRRLKRDAELSQARSDAGKIGAEAKKNKEEGEDLLKQNLSKTVNMNMNMNMNMKGEGDKEEVQEKEKRKRGPELRELDFPSDDWRELWFEWIDYKFKEKGDKYKTEKSEKIAFNKFHEDAEGNIGIAISAVKRAIQSNYRGIFINDGDRKKKTGPRTGNERTYDPSRYA